MRLNGLNAAEIGLPPNLQALVPGNGVNQAVINCDAGNGISVFDPEPFLVAADGDIVLGEDETAQAVGDGREDC